MKNVYAVTGTFHGSIIEAKSEGDARRAFHKVYDGESIVFVINRGKNYLFNWDAL